eukprot:13839042-Alexandrium_andersonii.AAC.1
MEAAGLPVKSRLAKHKRVLQWPRRDLSSANARVAAWRAENPGASAEDIRREFQTALRQSRRARSPRARRAGAGAARQPRAAEQANESQQPAHVLTGPRLSVQLRRCSSRSTGFSTGVSGSPQ